jgi:hypothetical protein
MGSPRQLASRRAPAAVFAGAADTGARRRWSRWLAAMIAVLAAWCTPVMSVADPSGVPAPADAGAGTPLGTMNAQLELVLGYHVGGSIARTQSNCVADAFSLPSFGTGVSSGGMDVQTMDLWMTPDDSASCISQPLNVVQKWEVRLDATTRPSAQYEATVEISRIPGDPTIPSVPEVWHCTRLTGPADVRCSVTHAVGNKPDVVTIWAP